VLVSLERLSLMDAPALLLLTSSLLMMGDRQRKINRLHDVSPGFFRYTWS
jgi:hypothetical protein